MVDGIMNHWQRARDLDHLSTVASISHVSLKSTSPDSIAGMFSSRDPMGLAPTTTRDLRG